MGLLDSLFGKKTGGHITGELIDVTNMTLDNITTTIRFISDANPGDVIIIHLSDYDVDKFMGDAGLWGARVKVIDPAQAHSFLISGINVISDSALEQISNNGMLAKLGGSHIFTNNPQEAVRITGWPVKSTGFP